MDPPKLSTLSATDASFTRAMLNIEDNLIVLLARNGARKNEKGAKTTRNKRAEEGGKKSSHLRHKLSA